MIQINSVSSVTYYSRCVANRRCLYVYRHNT